MNHETIRPRGSDAPSATRRRLLGILGAVGVAASGLPLAARAQAYPARPVRWIVPYAPGGSSDIVARLLAEAISGPLGQRVLVENKPGAATIVGTQALVSSTPDGYTIATADNATLYNNPYLYEKLPYELANLDFVAMLGQFPLILAVSGSVPATDLRTFIAWVKANPDKVSYASPGAGSPHHLLMEMLLDRTGMSMQHVPYKGDAPALQDLLTGNVQAMYMGLANARNYLNDPRVRILAVGYPTRLPAIPNVPTIAESGVPGYEAVAEQAVIAPVGIPREALLRLNREIGQAVTQPAVRERLDQFGMIPVVRTPDEVKAHVLRTNAATGDLIKRKAIKLS